MVKAIKIDSLSILLGTVNYREVILLKATARFMGKVAWLIFLLFVDNNEILLFSRFCSTAAR
jgi:hypothetical protein